MAAEALSGAMANVQAMVSNLAGKGAKDSKYFATTKKGEMHELKEELNSSKEDKKKEAVKKVIAAMTVGKDVSMLFTDVLNCMQVTKHKKRPKKKKKKKKTQSFFFTDKKSRVEKAGLSLHHELCQDSS
jgi:hypothetical protein